MRNASKQGLKRRDGEETAIYLHRERGRKREGDKFDGGVERKMEQLKSAVVPLDRYSSPEVGLIGDRMARFELVSSSVSRLIKDWEGNLERVVLAECCLSGENVNLRCLRCS